ncbi:methyltransferase [Saccharopolyspora sp. NPDC050389]|uniref:methyltransferase n=1 Tax=Saccharopolyspora sp. NPDC050389 TaxID=3155516 RepID=UPI003408002E
MNEPEDNLDRIIGAHWNLHILGAAVRLGIADHLAEGPRTVVDLAKAVGANSANAVGAFLSNAESFGLVRRVEGDRFAETPMLALLRRDGGAYRNIVSMLTGPGLCRPLEMLHRVVLRGRSHTEEALGQGLWSYYQDNPEEAASFADFMSELSGMVADSVLPRYSFSGRNKIIDVGGSNGTFLSRILMEYPDAAGVLFDLPNVIERARRNIAEQGLAARVEFVGGSFLEEVPEGGDIYLLKSVLSDWDDESCVRILSRCRDAAPPGTPVVVVDWLYHDDSKSLFDALDLRQLARVDGKVRTLPQYESLFESAALDLKRVDRPANGDAAGEWAPTTVFETIRR